MQKLEKNGPEQIIYKGKIFEVIKQSMKAGEKEIIFEIARRSPGVRLIIVKENMMLITKEFRSELDDFDYRLPGGKVFDTLDEYEQHREKDILAFALEAGKKECREETGLIAKNIKYFATAHAGATVIWDLFYCIVDDFEESEAGQELEHGECINIEWKTFEEIKELIKGGNMKEDRSIGVLFKFFLKYPEKYVRK
ncbi:NUDIX domain-containing protein [Candidatus Gracilibacteria bacterium]|nr:NUDIX domain-containing protein [Candidatus Gracilibacteria bacterium]NUJ98508.1 NUDIX domain-containing protein [Candidatus Gracilibacteria bacterium]